MSYGDWEEGKNKRAGHDGKGEERKGRRLPPFLFSHRPPRAFYFLIIAVLFSIFIGIQPEICGGERIGYESVTFQSPGSLSN